MCTILLGGRDIKIIEEKSNRSRQGSPDKQLKINQNAKEMMSRHVNCLEATTSWKNEDDSTEAVVAT